MIYIKENDMYFKYYTSYDNRLIRADCNNTETSVLGEVSGEFDALCDTNGQIHFILQGTGGELIYLLKEGEQWKKYNIFKSRKGIKKISNIRLYQQGKYLCAFYIMDHDGKKLMIKHRFCNDSLYEEPMVLGMTDHKGSYCICQRENEFVLIYKNENSTWIKCIIQKDFSIYESHMLNFEENIISIKTIGIKGKMYACTLVPKTNSAVLEFFCLDNKAEQKIISFGLPRSCVPEFIYSKGILHIQWEENSAVIEAYSTDNGLNFSKPARTGNACTLASVRLPKGEGTIISDKCAIYNFTPYMKDNIPNNKFLSERSTSGTLNTNFHTQKPYTPDNHTLFEKLKEIEECIDNMGKKLIEMCSCLETLSKYTRDDNIEITNEITNTKNDITSLGDVGEIDTDNVKLFESTDIDEILPENKPQEVI